MSLTVKSKKVDGVGVVDMKGRITCGEPQFLLRSTVRSFIEAGNNRVAAHGFSFFPAKTS